MILMEDRIFGVFFFFHRYVLSHLWCRPQLCSPTEFYLTCVILNRSRFYRRHRLNFIIHKLLIHGCLSFHRIPDNNTAWMKFFAAQSHNCCVCDSTGDNVRAVWLYYARYSSIQSSLLRWWTFEFTARTLLALRTRLLSTELNMFPYACNLSCVWARKMMTMSVRRWEGCMGMRREAIQRKD